MSRHARTILRWLWVALVVACFCVPLFFGLGRTDLGNDEAIYSFSVDVMLERGDWLTPKSIPREDMAFLEKPPLKFWIVAAPIRLGLLPHDEFGLRFWDALFGAVAFLYVFAIGRRMSGSLCGAVAVLVLFAHRPLLFEHGVRCNGMDSPLLLAYSAGMYHFQGWRDAVDARGRRLHATAVGLFFVLGFMTKLVAALFLPIVLALAVLFVRRDRLRAAGEWRVWVEVVVMAAAVCAPWFAYEYYLFGAELWTVMLGTHVLTRFTSFVDPGHLQPWHYYVSRLIAELQEARIAWFAVGAGAFLVARTFFARPASAEDRGPWPDGLLVLLWFVVPLVLISLGTSKLYHYLYPFLPPVALAVGYAAVMLYRWAASLLAAPVALFDQMLASFVRTVTCLPTVRVALWLVAAVSIALSASVLVLGHVRLGVGDLVLLRTSSLTRPLLVALLALTIAGRIRIASRLVVGLVVLSLLPVGAYFDNLRWLGREEHPLRTLAACMQPVAAREATGGTRGPGVYAETDHYMHPLSYYMRAIGPWRQSFDRSNASVFAALYLRAQPVLLSDARRREFAAAMEAAPDQVAAEAARLATVEVARARQARMDAGKVEAVGFPTDQLLLPAAYAPCAFLPDADARSRQ